MGHSMWLFYANVPSGSLIDSFFIFSSSMFGYLGVEIFFVLSGFLIGTIFINEFLGLQNKGKAPKFILIFWIKRWFRTIPNYYLYILLYLLVYYLLGWWANLGGFSYKYFFFIHNFFKAGPGFLGVSWSLSVEEWFYLILPSSFLLLYLLSEKPKIAIFFTFLLLLCVPLCLRLNFIVQHYQMEKVNSFFAFVTIYRLDSIAYGTILAWFWKKEKSKKTLLKYKFHLLVFGLLSMLCFLLYIIFFVLKPNQNPFLGLITYPWASISIVSVFPFLIDLENTEKGRLSNSIEFISKISYSLYLAHPLLIEVAEHFKKLGFSQNSLTVNIISFLLVILSSILLANLTYTFCERIFLNWRGAVIHKLFKNTK